MRSLGQFWYSILMILLSFAILAVFTVGYVSHAIRENNRPFCDVVVTITSPRPQPPVEPTVEPPTSSPEYEEFEKDLQKYRIDVADYNKNIAIKLENLSRKYKCNRSLS